MLAAGSAAGQIAPAIVIEDVRPDSSAAKAGVLSGDNLVSYGASPITSPASLQAREDNTFTSAAIVVRRGPETITINAPAGRLGMEVRPSMSSAVLALYDEGRAAERGKRIDEAIARWTAAARASIDRKESGVAAWLHGRVGDLHERERRWRDAIASHAAAWQLLEPGLDTAAKSRALTALGRCSLSANDLAAAQEWFERAGAVDEAAGNERWLAAALTSRGNVAYDRGNVAVARDSYQRALAIRDRILPDSLEVAGSLNGLGNADYRSGELVSAVDHHSRALAIRERLAPDSMDVAASLNNLGLVATDRGDLDAAREHHLRAIRIKERLAPDSLSMASSLTNFGMVAGARGDSATARDYHTRALRIYERLGPGSLAMADALNNLANSIRAEGDEASAEQHHRRALEIRERLAPDSMVLSVSLNNLGDAARRRGALTAARELYDRALDIRQRRAPESMNVAGTLNNLGLLSAAAGDLAASREYHRSARAIRERLAPDSLAVAASLSFLGGIALKEERFAEALALLSRTTAIVENQRWQVATADSRALLMANYTAAYTGLIRAHTALGDVPAAFAGAERLRARSLLDGLNEAGTKIRQAIDPALLQRQRRLRDDVNLIANRQQRLLGRSHTPAQAAAIKEELLTALTRLRELQAEIRDSDPRYGALTQVEPLALSAVQRDLLDDNTVLLEYVLGEEGSFVFAITKSSSRAFQLPARAEIQAAARRVHELMIARQPKPGETAAARRDRVDRANRDYPAAAGALSRMVLGPLADQFGGGRRLVIVADGALQYVPFAALPDPSAITQPLIVDHEVVNLPSASVLAILREQAQDRGRRPDRLVAVVADPVFDLSDPRLRRQMTSASPPSPALPANVADAVRAAGMVDDRGSLARLPFTRDEARAIVSAAPRQSMQAVDFRASRATVTGPDLGRYRVVHLAPRTGCPFPIGLT